MNSDSTCGYLHVDNETTMKKKGLRTVSSTASHDGDIGVIQYIPNPKYKAHPEQKPKSYYTKKRTKARKRY